MLEGYYRKHRAEGVRLVGLSADRHRDLGDVRRVMQAFSYPAAVLVDAKENGFGSPTALPVTYVVDRSGIVRARFLDIDFTRRPEPAAIIEAVQALGPARPQ